MNEKIPAPAAPERKSRSQQAFERLSNDFAELESKDPELAEKLSVALFNASSSLVNEASTRIGNDSSQREHMLERLAEITDSPTDREVTGGGITKHFIGWENRRDKN